MNDQVLVLLLQFQFLKLLKKYYFYLNLVKDEKYFFFIISITFSIFGIKSDVTILWSYNIWTKSFIACKRSCFCFWSFDSSSQSYVILAKFSFFKNDDFMSPVFLSWNSICYILVYIGFFKGLYKFFFFTFFTLTGFVWTTFIHFFYILYFFFFGINLN